MSNVCHENAAVTQLLADNKIQVMVKRAEACGSCAAKGACQALGGQTRDFFLTVENSVHAQVGDTVQLTLSDAAVMKASAILYLLPALCLIGFAILGSVASGWLRWSADGGAVAGAIAGLGLGFVATFFLSRRAEKNRDNIPVVTQVITTGNPQ